MYDVFLGVIKRVAARLHGKVSWKSNSLRALRFTKNMFKIGDFSRIARVSARLLRFYDEIGLLTPAHADAQTGYRYYTALNSHP